MINSINNYTGCTCYPLTSITINSLCSATNIFSEIVRSYKVMREKIYKRHNYLGNREKTAGAVSKLT